MRTQFHRMLFCFIIVSTASTLLDGCDAQHEGASPLASTTVGTEIDDVVITTKVKAALLSDSTLKSRSFKVETRKGKVQLSGYVDNQMQVDQAIGVARGVEGVKDVENKVSINGGSATVGNEIDDSILATKVRWGLLADADIKSFDIGIVTRKGEVQLSGFVDNQAEIDRAMAIARGIDGVQSVGNEMSIKK